MVLFEDDKYVLILGCLRLRDFVPRNGKENPGQKRRSKFPMCTVRGLHCCAMRSLKMVIATVDGYEPVAWQIGLSLGWGGDRFAFERKFRQSSGPLPRL